MVKGIERKLKHLQQMRARLRQGGNPHEIAEQRSKGKLTARERIQRLLDPGTFQELDIWGTPLDTGALVDYRKGPADAVSVGYGEVNGRPICVWSQDATVLRGTVATMHSRKITMIMEKALYGKLPIVGMLDSEGARIADAVQYPRFYSPEAIAYYHTLTSGLVPRISLIMGPCTGEMAIAASLADFVFMVKETGYMHIAPPPPGLTGDQVGTSAIHAEPSGCCDWLAENDEECLYRCRQLLSYLPLNCEQFPPVLDSGDDPNRREEELLGLVPFDARKAFDMRTIITLIADNEYFFELKPSWATNLITGFVRLGGQTAGIVANNPEVISGCLTLDAADKMARFVRFCDAFNIPLVWLADTPAFLPSVEEETRGLIRHGSKVVFANAEATVPQITVAIRKLYGGGGVAMPGIALGGDLDVAWPTVQRGLMGAEAAVSIIYKRELQGIEDESRKRERQAERIQEMQQRLKGLEREWGQDFIDPRDTRPFLINALKTLAARREERPQRKHENMRL